MWPIPERQDRAELLDLGVGTPQDVKDNFADLRRINRYLGGVSALTRHLYPALVSLQHSRDSITVLDLGTGSAEIPLAVADWVSLRHLELRIIGLDLSTRNLALADAEAGARPNIDLLQANALQLPFGAGSCDIVTSSLFLHHLAPDSVVEVLQAAFHCARHGLVMSDLVRGWLPLFAFWLVRPIFARNFLTRHDGMVSIRRAYSPDELSRLARQAGLKNVHVFTHWPWRMTLVAYK
jgi:SAM-dependent methyltransferase